MNEKTRTALEESIEHWKEIERGEGVDLGTYSCALCMEFRTHFAEPDCKGCPVAQKTGRRYCYDSPYSEWDNAMERLGRQMDDYNRVVDTPELVKLARAERKFLESLREKK